MGDMVAVNRRGKQWRRGPTKTQRVGSFMEGFSNMFLPAWQYSQDQSRRDQEFDRQERLDAMATARAAGTDVHSQWLTPEQAQESADAISKLYPSMTEDEIQNYVMSKVRTLPQRMAMTQKDMGPGFQFAEPEDFQAAGAPYGLPANLFKPLTIPSTSLTGQMRLGTQPQDGPSPPDILDRYAHHDQQPTGELGMGTSSPPFEMTRPLERTSLEARESPGMSDFSRRRDRAKEMSEALTAQNLEIVERQASAEEKGGLKGQADWLKSAPGIAHFERQTQNELDRFLTLAPVERQQELDQLKDRLEANSAQIKTDLRDEEMQQLFLSVHGQRAMVQARSTHKPELVWSYDKDTQQVFGQLYKMDENGEWGFHPLTDFRGMPMTPTITNRLSGMVGKPISEVLAQLLEGDALVPRVESAVVAGAAAKTREEHDAAVLEVMQQLGVDENTASQMIAAMGQKLRTQETDDGLDIDLSDISAVDVDYVLPDVDDIHPATGETLYYHISASHAAPFVRSGRHLVPASEKAKLVLMEMNIELEEFKKAFNEADDRLRKFTQGNPRADVPTSFQEEHESAKKLLISQLKRIRQATEQWATLGRKTSRESPPQPGMVDSSRPTTAPDPLFSFVKESMQRGIPYGEIRDQLIEVGWPNAQVNDMLALFADPNFAVPAR
jgi:hypothetical protein